MFLECDGAATRFIGSSFFSSDSPVGSAKNLKKRLAAYRVSNPERFPRRIIRLLNEVRRIEFDVCASEACARDREEQLICTLLPKFNRAEKFGRDNNRIL